MVVDTSTVPTGTQVSADPDDTNDGVFVVVVGPGDRIVTVDFAVSTPPQTVVPTPPLTGSEVPCTLVMAAGLLALGRQG